MLYAILQVKTYLNVYQVLDLEAQKYEWRYARTILSSFWSSNHVNRIICIKTVQIRQFITKSYNLKVTIQTFTKK